MKPSPAPAAVLLVLCALAGCREPEAPSAPAPAHPAPAPEPEPGPGNPRACVPVPEGDPWELALEWRWAEDGLSFLRSPMVGNLDDDGDGRVTSADIPDVVAVGGHSLPHSDGLEGPLLVLDGATGVAPRSVLYRPQALDPDRGVAVADVNGDGALEVVVEWQGRLTALGAGVDQVWAAELRGSDLSWPTVADLDNDGHTEVIDNQSIVDGRDGSTIATFDPTLPYPWSEAPVLTADLDLDGFREVVVGNLVFGADGVHRWSGFPSTRSHPAVVNADDDPEGELLFMDEVYRPRPDVGSVFLELRDTDGTLLAVRALAHRGELATADIDGDGAPEVIVSGDLQTTALALDGTVLWAVTHPRDAGPASAFDFDGDGASEVIVGDGLGFDILDGRTGESHVRTLVPVSHEAFPVIADIDGDGSAEILIAGEALTVWGNPSCLWPRAGAGWGLPDFNGENLGDDGSVPTDDPPIWHGTGNYRAR